MLEDHTKQRNLGLDREAAAWLNLGENHRDCVSLGGCEPSLAAYSERTLERGLLGVWVPGVPVLDVLVDDEDRLGQRVDGDSVFDLHLRLGEGTVPFCAA
jgi:hypothetical protein